MPPEHTSDIFLNQHQALADAACPYLRSSDRQQTPRPTQEEAYTEHVAIATQQDLDENATQLAQSNNPNAPLVSDDKSLDATSSLGHRIQTHEEASATHHALEGSVAATSRPLPSLLQYVDYELRQNVAVHNHPPVDSLTCPICLLPWRSSIPVPLSTNSLLSLDAPHATAITSTFLPLSPCGHWMHYYCFIKLTTYPENDIKDKCFVCHTPLFEWEGITTLVLATRTNLSVVDCNRNGSAHAGNGVWLLSDSSAYESDCALIMSLIGYAFFLQLEQPSKYPDGSPSLASAYNQVMNELQQIQKPSANWLSWTTQTGSLLLSMLVAIKMRGFLVDGHAEIMKTAAWTDFEEEGRKLQRRILDEVNKA